MNEKTVYLALGSNLGEREKHLEEALAALEGARGCDHGSFVRL